jgi:septal ring factor EnvC (AmiA/AmiB activator)
MAKKKKQIKFTQEELDSLSNLKNTYAQLELALGRVEMARIQVEQRMEQIEDEKLRLETQYSEVKKQEQNLVVTLNEKYGDGNLNPETGVFTPNEK